MTSLRIRSALVATLLLALLPRQAGAVEVPSRFMGGMGFAVWPMKLSLPAQHQGVGLGISGRVMARFKMARLQLGLYQGSFEEDDLSTVKRSFIFAGAEVLLPLPGSFYATVGSRFGAAHLRVTETLQQEEDSRRVHDLDEWEPMAQPLTALGLLLARKYHFEAEVGSAISYSAGQWRVSATFLIGIYFRMDRDES